MRDSDRYAKIVQWSEEDQCYVGSAPDLMYGGCHGDDEHAVFDELCQIVEEIVETYKQDGTPLPPPSPQGLFEAAVRPPGSRGKESTAVVINKLRKRDVS